MKRIISICICFVSLVSYGQQTPQRNVYGYNKYSINPAYAGATACTEINFSHLNQWVKVEGAPLTSLFSANGRIGKSFGLGGQVMVDQIGMIQQVSGLVSLSYGFSIANEHHVRIGTSAGYNQYRIDPTSAIAFDPDDPIINGGVQAGGTINMELGLMYAWKALELSIGSQQFIQSTSNMPIAGVDGYGLRRHLNSLIAYNLNIRDKWRLTPSVFAKGTNNGYQLDMNADVCYKDFIYGGMGYRTSVGIVGRLGIQIQDLFFIGYAYEAPMSNIASYSSGSHEVILGIKFCKKDKKDEIPPIAEVKKEEPDTTRNETRKEPIATEPPAMDTIVITKIDTVYIEAPIVEVKEERIEEVKEIKPTFNPIDKDILFEFDKSIVKRESFAELESIINILNSRPNMKISLKGHTDAVGPDAYNINLSKNRVSAVREFLISNGIDDNRILIEALGEKVPVAENSSEAGRKKNRRVEVRFIEK
jgi:type IX secretion system PorP/SprF family membrane protein